MHAKVDRTKGISREREREKEGKRAWLTVAVSSDPTIRVFCRCWGEVVAVEGRCPPTRPLLFFDLFST